MARNLEGDEMAGILSARGVNLNTVAILVGFLSTLIAITWSYSNLTFEQKNFGEFIIEQKEFNAKVDERFKAGGERLQQIPIMTADLARIEAANAQQDDRMGRMSESSGNAISDIRNGLSDIKTDVALVKQSLSRIEAFQNMVPPRAAAR